MYEMLPVETTLYQYNFVELFEMKTPVEGTSPVMMQYEDCSPTR